MKPYGMNVSEKASEGLAGSPRPREASPRRKKIYLALGLVFLAIGLLGLVLPLLPTTAPLIVASGFLVHGSPRLYRWLHGNRLTGPYIRAYTEKQGLSLRRKIGTIAFLWAGLGLSAWLLRDSTWAWWILGAVGIGVSIHVALLRRERRLDGSRGEQAAAIVSEAVSEA